MHIQLFLSPPPCVSRPPPTRHGASEGYAVQLRINVRLRQKISSLTLASIMHSPFPKNVSDTLQTTFSTAIFAFSLKQAQSSAGAFDLTDP